MSREQLAIACEKYAIGHDYKAIAKILGINRDTVSRNIKKFYLPKVKNPAIMVVESRINNISDNQGND